MIDSRVYTVMIFTVKFHFGFNIWYQSKHVLIIRNYLISGLVFYLQTSVSETDIYLKLKSQALINDKNMFTAPRIGCGA